MMCIFCSGSLKQSTTDCIERNDNHVILIQDVPCEKCGQCGEAFFDTSAIKVVERILDSIQHISSEISLTVIEYKKNAA